MSCSNPKSSCSFIFANVFVFKGDDSVIDCILMKNGTIIVKYSYNVPGVNMEIPDVRHDTCKPDLVLTVPIDE